MKKINVLLVFSFICFIDVCYGMDSTSSFTKVSEDRPFFSSGHPAVSVEASREDRKPVEGRMIKKEVIPFGQINKYSFPKEIFACIAGYCEPREKNLLMKLCHAFNACLKDREYILQANPDTVSREDKKKGMFLYARTGDTEKLLVWIKALKRYAFYMGIDAKNILGNTALKVAAENKQINAMRMLVEHDADTGVLFESDLLHRSVYNGDIEMVKVLLELKANPDRLYSSSSYGECSPLLIAVQENNVEMVRLLLAAKASVKEGKVAKLLLERLEKSEDRIALVEKILDL